MIENDHKNRLYKISRQNPFHGSCRLIYVYGNPLSPRKANHPSRLSRQNLPVQREQHSWEETEHPDKYRKSDVIVGIEPTGHYWFDLGAYLEDEGILLVMVNPYAVKQTKELDDNSQSKNDRKDPKVIAKLVTEGRYSAPYTPDGVYADLRIMVANRKRLIREMTQIKNIWQICF